MFARCRRSRTVSPTFRTRGDLAVTLVV